MWCQKRARNDPVAINVLCAYDTHSKQCCRSHCASIYLKRRKEQKKGLFLQSTNKWTKQETNFEGAVNSHDLLRLDVCCGLPVQHHQIGKPTISYCSTSPALFAVTQTLGNLIWFECCWFFLCILCGFVGGQAWANILVQCTNTLNHFGLAPVGKLSQFPKSLFFYCFEAFSEQLDHLPAIGVHPLNYMTTIDKNNRIFIFPASRVINHMS